MTSNKPAAYMMVNREHDLERSLHFEPQNWHITWDAVPLYLHPHTQAEPLTTDAIKEIWWDTLEQSEDESPEVRFTRFTRAIEKAHGIGGAVPPRPAVRLSDETLRDIWMASPPRPKLGEELDLYARAIEAAHGIKGEQ